MAYPVSRKLTKIIPGATFRSKERPTHGGIDFTPLVSGTHLPVYSVGAGVVIIADSVAEKGDTSGKDIGIRLDGDKSIWWYGHLASVEVVKGQRVKDGQRIGLMGTTGTSASGKPSSSGVHLHLERHYPALNDETDPWSYIKNEPDPFGVKADGDTAASDDKTGVEIKISGELIDMPVIIEAGTKDYFGSEKGGAVLVENQQHREQLEAALKTWRAAIDKGGVVLKLGKYNGGTLVYYLNKLAKA